MSAETTVKPKQAGADKKKMKFRILIGCHLGDGPDGPNTVFEARRPEHPANYDRDIIESDVDLCKRFNVGPYSRKFERID